MSTNLVSTVMEFVTPDVIRKVAAVLGIDRAIVQKAGGAAIPAILASLASLASKPGGAQQLSETLMLQKSGTMENIINAIGGTGQSAHAEEGADLLSSLMGSGGLNALTSAISSYAGIGTGKSGTLLGLLGTMVMGALGQQQRKAGLDANGLASMLTSQKDQIAAALPSGFTSYLRDAGFLDTIDGNMRRTAEAASASARRVSDMAEQATMSTARRASVAPQRMTTWPYWLGAIAILAGLGWMYMANQNRPQVAQDTSRETTRPAPQPSETTGAGTPNQTVADLTGQLTRSVDGMRTTLQGISDSASAQAAMPRLQQMTAELDKISNATTGLSPQAKSAVAAQVASAMPAFNQLCDRVLAIPGVAGVAKPVIESMRTKLEAMSRA